MQTLPEIPPLAPLVFTQHTRAARYRIPVLSRRSSTSQDSNHNRSDQHDDGINRSRPDNQRPLHTPRLHSKGSEAIEIP